MDSDGGGGRLLVVGSFPPVGGPAAAASLAAVRQGWADGFEVVTASIRPGAADIVGRVVGLLAGRRLDQVRVASGAPDRLVLNLEPAMLRGRSRRGAQAAAAISLLRLQISLRHFDHVTILLTEPLGLPAALLRPLWHQVDSVLIPRGQDSRGLAPGASFHKVGDLAPFRSVAQLSGVTPLGPPEALRGERLEVLADKIGRRLLGEHFEAVRDRGVRLRSAAKKQAAPAIRVSRAAWRKRFSSHP